MLQQTPPNVKILQEESSNMILALQGIYCLQYTDILRGVYITSDSGLATQDQHNTIFKDRKVTQGISHASKHGEFPTSINRSQYDHDNILNNVNVVSVKDNVTNISDYFYTTT